MTIKTWDDDYTEKMDELRVRVREKLHVLKNILKLTEALNARLTPPYITHEALRRRMANERSKEIELPHKRYHYNMPDPVVQKLHENYIANTTTSTPKWNGPEERIEYYLNKIDQREITKKQYNALLRRYKIKPEQPSNPVEDRPTILYPDARQYKADMRKLAKGLEKRLKAV